MLSPISLRTEYETAKEVRIGMVQLRAVDAGLNAVNSNYEISVAAAPVAIGACTSETNFSYTPRTTIGGAAIFDDLVFYRPCTGNYSVTFSAPGIDSVSLMLRYHTGYPAALDAALVTPSIVSSAVFVEIQRAISVLQLLRYETS